MTDALRYQRRWEVICGYIKGYSNGLVEPVVMPHWEGGGILIIRDGVAWHFINAHNCVFVEIRDADKDACFSPLMEVFSFNDHIMRIAQQIVAEVLLDP